MRSHLLRACPVERKPHRSRWSGTATPRSQRPRGRPATAFHPRGWGPRVTTRSTHQVRRHHLGARRRRHDPGMDGNDRICGGEDDDDIYGDPGNDRLFRGLGGDRVEGAPARTSSRSPLQIASRTSSSGVPETRSRLMEARSPTRSMGRVAMLPSWSETGETTSSTGPGRRFPLRLGRLRPHGRRSRPVRSCCGRAPGLWTEPGDRASNTLTRRPQRVSGPSAFVLADKWDAGADRVRPRATLFLWQLMRGCQPDRASSRRSAGSEPASTTRSSG
jgi:Ca2+-binding RTX toxin-like protein